MTKKTVHTSGKRKTAVARATINEGDGTVRINSVPLDNYGSEIVRMKIKQTIMQASEYLDLNKINIGVNVYGGGTMGQADAIASSIARGLVEWTKSDDLLQKYISHDRTIIAGDYRQTEVHKPCQSSKGPRHKRQKSYR